MPLSPEEETSALVAAAQAGDAKAFDRLVTLHHDKVYGQALQMLKSPHDAQDVAQVAWVKAWQKLSDFRGDSAFTSWIYRITTFAAIDFIRKRKSRKETSSDSETLEFLAHSEPATQVPPTQLKRLEQKELRAAIDDALAALPEKLGSALRLREIDGLSYDEIAKALGCKAGTVMSRIFNARKAIQKHLSHLIK